MLEKGKIYKKWTIKELSFIQDNLDKMTGASIARALGVDIRHLYDFARRQNIHFSKNPGVYKVANKYRKILEDLEKHYEIYLNDEMNYDTLIELLGDSIKRYKEYRNDR